MLMQKGEASATVRWVKPPDQPMRIAKADQRGLIERCVHVVEGTAEEGRIEAVGGAAQQRPLTVADLPPGPS
jgi:hypothetical protein